MIRCKHCCRSSVLVDKDDCPEHHAYEPVAWYVRLAAWGAALILVGTVYYGALEAIRWLAAL